MCLEMRLARRCLHVRCRPLDLLPAPRPSPLACSHERRLALGHERLALLRIEQQGELAVEVVHAEHGSFSRSMPTANAEGYSRSNGHIGQCLDKAHV